MLAAHALSNAVQLPQGWLWLPEATKQDPPFISPGSIPCFIPGQVPQTFNLPELSCSDGPDFSLADRLLVQAEPQYRPLAPALENELAIQVPLSNGLLSVELLLVANHNSQFFQMTVDYLFASFEPSSSSKKHSSKLADSHCLIGLEVSLRADLHTGQAQIHLPLHSPLQKMAAGKHLPKHIPLNFVQLIGVSALNTLQLQPGSDEQPSMASVRSSTSPLGEKGLQHDVYLTCCSAVDNDHTAFRLARNAACNFALSLARREIDFQQAPHEPMIRGQDIDITELQLRIQTLAGGFSRASASTPIQMSAILPQPLSPGSPVQIAVVVQATVGVAVPASQQRRLKGCKIASLPVGASRGPWTQSTHRLAMGHVRASPL
ncbi:hypothetical protein WJX74_004508 [Apatococcus lobatus]|uniref:Uncharacterized protein n=1 Tax=Apatococcus lobatus TaxID=904363 RepID=A0AAW1R272_9CHLO